MDYCISLSMIIPTKQIILTIAVLSIGIASIIGYNTVNLVYGQESNSHIPDFPEIPDFPDPPEPPCLSPCPPNAENCIDVCWP